MPDTSVSPTAPADRPDAALAAPTAPAARMAAGGAPMSYRAALRSSGGRPNAAKAFAIVPFSAMNLVTSDQVDVHAPPAKVVPSSAGQHVLAFPVPPATQVCDVSAEINKLAFEGGFSANVFKSGNFATVSFSSAAALEAVGSCDFKILDMPAKPMRLIQYRKSIFRVKLQNTGILPDPVAKARQAYAAMQPFGEILDIILYREEAIERHFADTVCLIMDIGERTELPATVEIGEHTARIISSCSPITCNYCKLTGHIKSQCPTRPGNKKPNRPAPPVADIPGANFVPSLSVHATGTQRAPKRLRPMDNVLNISMDFTNSQQETSRNQNPAAIFSSNKAASHAASASKPNSSRSTKVGKAPEPTISAPVTRSATRASQSSKEPAKSRIATTGFISSIICPSSPIQPASESAETQQTADVSDKPGKRNELCSTEEAVVMETCNDESPAQHPAPNTSATTIGG